MSVELFVCVYVHCGHVFSCVFIEQFNVSFVLLMDHVYLCVLSSDSNLFLVLLLVELLLWVDMWNAGHRSVELICVPTWNIYLLCLHAFVMFM